MWVTGSTLASSQAIFNQIQYLDTTGLGKSVTAESDGPEFVKGDAAGRCAVNEPQVRARSNLRDATTRISI